MYLPFKGPGKRGYIVAETLLPTQMLPATFFAEPNPLGNSVTLFKISSYNRHLQSKVCVEFIH